MTKHEFLTLLDDPDVRQKITAIVGVHPLNKADYADILQKLASDNEDYRLTRLARTPPPAAGPSEGTSPGPSSPVSA